MAKFMLGLVEYPRKKDAITEVRRILYASRLGVRLEDSDLATVEAIFNRHPSKDQKAAPGFAGFTVRTIEFRPGIVQRCFHIMHPDGTETDFSFLVALGMAPSAPTLAAAARNAVADAMLAFKQAHFGENDCSTCQETGQTVGYRDAHVDHAHPWPFSRIVAEFARDVGTPTLKDDPYTVVFANAADADAFRIYHDARAVLRIVDAKVNMSMGARAPKTT